MTLNSLCDVNDPRTDIQNGRLTASKEAGATIEIDGRKVALGVPGAQRPTDTAAQLEAFPLIPLRRGGTPDDAASSVLLYVLSRCRHCGLLMLI